MNARSRTPGALCTLPTARMLWDSFDTSQANGDWVKHPSIVVILSVMRWRRSDCYLVATSDGRVGWIVNNATLHPPGHGPMLLEEP